MNNYVVGKITFNNTLSSPPARKVRISECEWCEKGVYEPNENCPYYDCNLKAKVYH